MPKTAPMIALGTLGTSSLRKKGHGDFQYMAIKRFWRTSQLHLNLHAVYSMLQTFLSHPEGLAYCSFSCLLVDLIRYAGGCWYSNCAGCRRQFYADQSKMRRPSMFDLSMTIVRYIWMLARFLEPCGSHNYVASLECVPRITD